jgi:hypothetical protein
MTQEDQLFIADVVVTNPTRETMVSSVISWLEGAMAKLNVIAKFANIKGFMKGTILFRRP